MWLFITTFNLDFLCLFISCGPAKDRYNNLTLTSFFDPVAWAINHKACIEDWLLVKGGDLETKIETNQNKIKYIERFFEL